METELPLVVDNGTGVSTYVSHAAQVPFVDLDAQFVKVGYAGSNFPEHGSFFLSTPFS